MLEICKIAGGPINTMKNSGSTMTFTKDVFFRSHVVEVDAKEPRIGTYDEPKWPDYALVFDTETTLDPKDQALLFGVFRVCRLIGNSYVCVEEGIFHADELCPDDLEIIARYKVTFRSEVASGDYDEDMHVYSRSEFVEKVFFEAIRARALIVAFNAPWDISRVSVGYRISRNRAWTLILAQRTSRKTGYLEPNPERPCMRVTSKDSKAAFFSLTKPKRPEEWPTYKVGDKTRLICRVLDLRTLAWALFNESHSLKTACKDLHTKNQKLDHDPTGRVTIEELNYGRQDIRCTVDVLNALKEEFDRHPLELHPDKAVSPASIGKAYLKALGITPLKQKFNVPDHIHGIASQAYFGGRAECRIRNTPLPVVLTDFSSQYPTVNALLGNREVLIAESLTFEDATKEITEMVKRITLDNCFDPTFWRKFRFFARVLPDEDVLPVRAEYNNDGVTKNIAVNYFSSREPIWLSGPDVIASKLLTGKAPRIEKAIRMVPHGQQKGLKPVSLRGMVEVDPQKDDLFRVMVEQKQVYKTSDEALSYFLKICANSTSYGMFFELTPQKKFNPVRVKVFSGKHSHEQTVKTVEKPGEWYFPPIAALITGGAHLFLAMLECCVTERGGHYLFCDTDSMCIVASKSGGWVACPNEPRIKALSWKEVENIAKRFESLNCYDSKKVPGSILKIEKINFQNKKQIELFGFAISAKRYVLYRYDAHGNIVIADAKAHGLGYLYPPKDSDENDEEDWLFEAWHSVLEGEVAAPRPAPKWFPFPAMMRMSVSTPAVLGMLKGFTRPFNFVHVPLLFPNLYPAGKDASNFGLIMPFSKHRDTLLEIKATDTHSGEQHSISLLDPKGRTKKIEVKCYGNILGAYREHPEAKFLDHEGNPCGSLTRGLLRRSHIVANRHRYIGKETSRRWEQGDDMSMVDFVSEEYSDGKAAADPELRKQIVDMGIRKLARATKIDSKTIMLISRGEHVKASTLAKLIKSFDHAARPVKTR